MKLALHLLAVLLTVEVSAPWPSAPWPVSSCLKCCRRKKDAEKKMEAAKAAEERSGLLDDRAKLGGKEATRVDKEIKEVRKRTKKVRKRTNNKKANARTEKQNEAAKQQEDEQQRKEAGAEFDRKQAEYLKALESRQRAQKAQAVIDAKNAEAAKEAAKKALDDAWDAEKDAYTQVVAFHFPPLAVHETNWPTMPVQQYHSRVVRATFDESQKFLEMAFTKRSEFIEQRSFLGLKAALKEVNRIFVAYANVFVQKRGVNKPYNCGDKSGMAQNQKGGKRNPIKVSTTMLPSGLSDDALVALACNVLRAVDPGHRYCRPSDSMREQGLLGFSLNMALVSFNEPPYNAPDTVPGNMPLKCHVHLT